ncbi:MAG TPA: DNA polymerase III subunit delta [Bacteroidales bacterium]|jgi:DNA polymerase-3 subunit delta|nr:DNA polymerase III subunit delta [Bacteroidales bacterium]HQM70578.1 DNA polymerase III subunit delta [Bacteroidales bacterium]
MDITYEEIISDIRKRIFKPVYFLAGEEPYYIDLITDYIEQNVLPESERSFNQMVIYGEDTTVSNIIEISRKYPMMASHQVIIVKEAQVLKKIDDLLIYVEKPLLSTLLVINYKYKTLDKRTKLFKLLGNQGVYFESNRLRDYQIPGWIDRFLMSQGIKSDPRASAMLTEFLGNDLHKIANELNKLIITLPKNKPVITTGLIEKNIGISKDYNNFELQKAIGERNILKANMIVQYFAANPKDNPITLTIASLFSYFSKLLTYHYLTDKSKNNAAAALKINPFFVRDYETAATKYNVTRTLQAISLLRIFDMKSKGFGDMGSEPGDLLKELVYKILHL